MLRLYHRTTEAKAAQILKEGFRDTPGRYLTDREWSGVWISDRPLDNTEGASGEVLLQIEIAEGRIKTFEWLQGGRTFREWIVPAAVLNDFATVSVNRRGP